MCEDRVLEVEGLAFARGTFALEDITFCVGPGEIVALVGSNGSGKSTILRLVMGFLRPRAGSVRLFGRPRKEYRGQELARLLAFLPQEVPTRLPLSVAELVQSGRYPYRGLFAPLRLDEVAREALEVTGTWDLRHRNVGELSGGERQRVYLAMALAQRPRLFLLDEPTTFLDLAHQVEFLDLLERLARQEGFSVLLVLHDLSLAARVADRFLVLARGRLVADGPPAEVLTEELLRDAFGLSAAVRIVEGVPVVVPHRKGLLGTTRDVPELRA